MLGADRIVVALNAAGTNEPYMLDKHGIKGVSAVGDLSKIESFTILPTSRPDLGK